MEHGYLILTMTKSRHLISPRLIERRLPSIFSCVWFCLSPLLEHNLPFQKPLSIYLFRLSTKYLTIDDEGIIEIVRIKGTNQGAGKLGRLNGRGGQGRTQS